MTINIELKPDEELALFERARLSGRDPALYVRMLIQDDIQSFLRSSGQDEAAAEGAAALDALIDHQFVADCEGGNRREGHPDDRGGATEALEDPRISRPGDHRRAGGPLLNGPLFFRFQRAHQI
jgi:hypothetical protein